MPAAEPYRPNLYLVGFMGTGKTTVGRVVARELKLDFLDTDAEIEAQEGRTIPDIFAKEGERYFRQLERTYIESGHTEAGCLVSCGGGLVVQPGMAELLRRKGIVVSLIASPETILRRTSGNSNRPLLQCENPAEKIRTMLQEREPHYLAAGTSVMTDHRSLKEVVRSIVRIYKREQARRRGD